MIDEPFPFKLLAFFFESVASRALKDRRVEGLEVTAVGRLRHGGAQGRGSVSDSERWPGGRDGFVARKAATLCCERNLCCESLRFRCAKGSINVLLEL